MRVMENPVVTNVLKLRTLFSFCSQIKCWLSRLKFRKTNRAVPDQNASLKAVLIRSVLFVCTPFWQATCVGNFTTVNNQKMLQGCIH